MRLILGGYAQGKLRYALETYHLALEEVWDAENPTAPWSGQKIIYHTEALFLRWIQEGKDPKQELAALLPLWEDCVIILQEVGSGLVPMTALQRTYRETVGELGQLLVSRADTVERVLFGIGKILKAKW